MLLSRKQKLSLIPLLLYWPILFALMHINLPLSRIGSLGISDKILHFLAYLILVFALWFALRQDAKVNWRKPITWWIILGLIIHGLIDEWLQSFVGRDPDILDLAADAAAIFTGLLVLSIVPFYPAALGLTAVVIYFFTRILKLHFSEQLPVLVTGLHMILYGFFTLLWIRCLKNLKSKFSSLVYLFTGPIVVLIGIEMVYTLSTRNFGNLQFYLILASMLAITVTILVYYSLTHFHTKAPPDIADN